MTDRPSVIKYINLVFGTVFLLSLLFIYNNSMLGIIALIYGGIEGIVIIACSLILINFLKIKQSIIVGAIGSTLIGINILYLTILHLIDPNRYLILIGYYFGLIIWIIFSCTYIILYIFKTLESKEDELVIKKTVLDLATKFPRLKIKEISEKCKKDLDLILKVILEMLKNQEIYGEYFPNTKSIVFNQQANIDEIDKLMVRFEEWEKNKIGKRN